jgi:replication factor A2
MVHQEGSLPVSSGSPVVGIENNQGSSVKENVRDKLDEQTIQPCTIGMMLQIRSGADDSNSLVLPDGRKVHHVAFVGAIKVVIQEATYIEYVIEDGTGSINVREWVNQETDCAAKLDMRKICVVDIYVKVVALPKVYSENVLLIAESIRPITSGNELNCHLLDVVYAGEKYINRGKLVLPQRALPGSISIQKAEGIDVRDAVINFIWTESNKSDVGAEIAICVSQLGLTYGETAVRKVVEDLTNEGLIYSTTNELFYKHAMHYS